MKTSNKILTLLIIMVTGIALLGVAVCLNLHKISGTPIHKSGVNDIKKLSFEKFNSLDITGPFEIDISIGNKNSIELSGDSNILSCICFKNEDNKLYIYSETPIITENHLKLKIITKHIKNLELWGTGPAYIKNIDNDNFRISLNGKGCLYAQGTTENLEIECNGEAYIDAENLKAENVGVNLFGDGNVRTATGKALILKIDGAGVFTGYGKTEKLIIKCSGAGNVDTVNLKAENADITLNGASKAKVFVEEVLNVSITGLGKVIYYGKPKRIQQSIRGLGCLINGEKEDSEK